MITLEKLPNGLVRFDDRVSGEIGCLNADLSWHHGSVRTGIDSELQRAIDEFKMENK